MSFFLLDTINTMLRPCILGGRKKASEKQRSSSKGNRHDGGQRIIIAPELIFLLLVQLTRTSPWLSGKLSKSLGRRSITFEFLQSSSRAKFDGILLAILDQKRLSSLLNSSQRVADSFGAIFQARSRAASDALEANLVSRPPVSRLPCPPCPNIL